MIGPIALPERCANLCFGGVMGNRLFRAASQRFTYFTTTGVPSYSADGSGAARSTVVALTGLPVLSAGSAGDLFFTSKTRASGKHPRQAAIA